MAGGRVLLLPRDTDRGELFELHHASDRAAADGGDAAAVWRGRLGAMECEVANRADCHLPELVHYQCVVAPKRAARFSGPMARAAGRGGIGAGGKGAQRASTAGIC